LGQKSNEFGEAFENEKKLEVKLVKALAEVHLLIVNVTVAHLFAK
jgi:hypothetical protein